MERAIITISENGRVNIPSGNVWMSEMELVELFGVIAPTLRANIGAIYKCGLPKPETGLVIKRDYSCELLNNLPFSQSFIRQ